MAQTGPRRFTGRISPHHAWQHRLHAPRSWQKPCPASSALTPAPRSGVGEAGRPEPSADGLLLSFVRNNDHPLLTRARTDVRISHTLLQVLQQPAGLRIIPIPDGLKGCRHYGGLLLGGALGVAQKRRSPEAHCRHQHCTVR